MKILSYEKDFFFVQAKMRSEVFCWKVGRRRGRWTPPQPTTVTMWPGSMRNSSKVLCITTTAILLRYAFCIIACITSPPTACWSCRDSQFITNPPIHHRIFFLSAFNCVKVTLLSNPATISLNQLCACQPTHCRIG